MPIDLRKQSEKMDGSLDIRQAVLIRGSTVNLPLQKLVALSVLSPSYFLMAKFWSWGSEIDSYRSKS